MKDKLAKTTREFMTEHQLCQEELANLANIPQPVVSKVLNKRWKRYTGQVRTLADYVGFTKTIDPGESRMIMDAIANIWDGSKDQERAITELIQSIGNYTSIIK